jgi:multidrug transporter EmrE-like cation transporter
LLTWLFAGLSVVLGSVGQVYLKLGSGKIFELHTIIGVIFYGVAFLLWLQVLAAWPLSKAYPLLAVNFILVAVFSSIFLHEQFSAGSILGTILCTIGVVCVGLSK